MKRFRYRKVTPEILEKMKKLRNKGLTYSEIAKKFNIECSTVLYHLSLEYKKKRLKNSNEWNKKHKIPSAWQRDPEYVRNYMRERYQKDLEFRKKIIKANSRCAKIRRKEGREWSQLHPEETREYMRNYYRNKKVEKK